MKDVMKEHLEKIEDAKIEFPSQSIRWGNMAWIVKRTLKQCRHLDPLNDKYLLEKEIDDIYLAYMRMIQS